MFEAIRHAARQVDPSDLLTVRRLAEAVTANLESIPSQRALLVGRLTDLQLRSFAGEVAFDEGKLVASLNAIADRIGMPDYGRTSALEFHVLRLFLLGYLPEINPAAAALLRQARDGDDPASTVLPSMQPMEAAWTVSVLCYQKRMNPDYQKTAKEFEQTAHARCEQRKRSPRLASQRESHPYLIGAMPDPHPERRVAIQAAFARLGKYVADPAQFVVELDNFVSNMKTV